LISVLSSNVCESLQGVADIALEPSVQKS
jgi:hypothetical protein